MVFRIEKKFTEIKNLKENSFVLIEDVPCKVDSVQTSKPGKHGGAKARVVAEGVFDGKKRNIIGPADMKVDVPIIEKKAMQLIAIIGDTAQLMNPEDYSTIDVQIPEEFRGQLVQGEDVLVWQFGSYIMIKGKKA
jgi:translation initiation factor 5A